MRKKYLTTSVGVLSIYWCFIDNTEGTETSHAETSKTERHYVKVQIEFQMETAPVVGCALCVPLVLLLILRRYFGAATACPNKARLDGKTVIITGATSGIGKATATECARRGARVILACRNIGKAQATVTGLRRVTFNEDIHFIQLDLGSLRSVRDFVYSFARSYQSADALVNNAAYMGPKARSSDGFDMTFHVNYLGHFLLTNLLIKKCQPSTQRPLRVINVASDAYRQVTLDFDDLMMDKGTYDIYGCYGKSKLAQMLITSELNFHYSDLGVTCVSVHPGPVNSGLLRSYPGVTGKLLRGAATLLFRSPQSGCQSVVYCLVADSLSDCYGRLVYDCRAIEVAPHARNYRAAEQLWAVSTDLCRMGETDLLGDVKPDASVHVGNGKSVAPSVVKPMANVATLPTTNGCSNHAKSQ